MKVLFYGGAFNPVTKAHIELANYVRKELSFDKVLFVPTKDKYIKHDEGKDFVFKGEIRKQMLDKVALSNNWMLVSDYELNLEEQPRTYETLCYFKENYNYDLKLLIGSDWLLKLKTSWRYVDEIAREFGFVVMARGEDNFEEMIENDSFLSSLKKNIILVHTPQIYRNISSTNVRKCFLEKKNCVKEMLPKEITEEYLNILKGEF